MVICSGVKDCLCRSFTSCTNSIACGRRGPSTFFFRPPQCLLHAKHDLHQNSSGCRFFGRVITHRSCFTALPCAVERRSLEANCFDHAKQRVSTGINLPSPTSHSLCLTRGVKTAAPKKNSQQNAGKGLRENCKPSSTRGVKTAASKKNTQQNAGKGVGEKSKPSKQVQVLETEEEDEESSEEEGDEFEYGDDEDIEGIDIEAIDDDDDETMSEDDNFDDDLLEEGDEDDALLGDGGDGGGVKLGNTDWGEKALLLAKEVLENFGSNFALYAFKVSPEGRIYVRLDKLSDRYGSPSMLEIESFSSLFGKRLEKAGQDGILPDNLALEVSSPGAERMVLVPDQLLRFKDIPMFVRYVEAADAEVQGLGVEKDGVLELESFEAESGMSVWKVANVRTNRDQAGKGRGLTRKQKDWRARLPITSLRVVRLYLDV